MADSEGLRAERDHLLQAQAELEASRDEYAEYFERAPLPILIVTSWGVVQKANLAAAALFEDDRGRLRGRSLRLMIDADDRSNLALHLSRCRTDAAAQSCDLLLMIQGSRVPVKLVSRRGSREQDAIQTTIIDLRERRGEFEQIRRLVEAERRAREESQAKDHFIAMLSHELRTPLTPVLAAASVGEERPELTPELRQIFAMIRRNVAAEARLIDDLLDLTGIVRRKLSVKREPVDLHDVVREAIEILDPEQAGARRSVNVELTATEHHVLGDSLRLRQVFWNLLRNALKYTSPTGVISVRSWNHQGRVLIEVADDGIGFEMDDVKRLFEPFDRLHEHPHSSSGLGLGLAISKGLVELHEGSIHAQSPGPGRGARFVVELPTSAELPIPVAPAQAASSPPPSSAARRVLLVEDHEDTILMMTELLRSSGYEVFAACSVSEARRADRESFDLIVSDIGLPDGTGLELIKELQLGGHKPAIALSGYGTPLDIEASKAAGFDLHLTKPVDVRQLLDAVQSLSAR